MFILTEETLKQSQAYKDWTSGAEIVNIHNTNHDSEIPYNTFIVIQKYPIEESGDEQTIYYSILRFFTMGSNVACSVDYEDITAEEVFTALLSVDTNVQYTRGVE